MLAVELVSKAPELTAYQACLVDLYPTVAVEESEVSVLMAVLLT